MTFSAASCGNYILFVLCQQVSTIPKMKCKCGAVLIIDTCPKSSSIRIAITDPDVQSDNPLWLTAFTDRMNVMLKNVSDKLSSLSTEDDIET